MEDIRAWQSTGSQRHDLTTEQQHHTNACMQNFKLMLVFFFPQKNGIISTTLFFFFFLENVSWASFHIITCILLHSLLNSCTAFHCKNCIYFIFPISYLGCFQFYFAILDNAAINNLVHISFCTCVFLQDNFPVVKLLVQRICAFYSKGNNWQNEKTIY